MSLNGTDVRDVPHLLEDVSAYVEQEDALYALSTVRLNADVQAEICVSLNKFDLICQTSQ